MKRGSNRDFPVRTGMTCAKTLKIAVRPLYSCYSALLGGVGYGIKRAPQ
jgi:hypothetical protein